MARLAAVENALYYPTPPHLVEALVRQHLRLDAWAEAPTYMLDPCAGEGVAIHALAEAWRTIPNSLSNSYYQSSYDTARTQVHVRAVELDNQRARLAGLLLGEENVLHRPIEHTAVHGEFNLVFLNPPYDDSSTGRQELAWIRMAEPWLTKRGTMILVLPEMFVGQGRHAGKLARLLYSLHLLRPLVLRFPDPEYQPFKQVFVVVHKETDTYTVPNLIVQGTLGQCRATTSHTGTYVSAPPTLAPSSLVWTPVSSAFEGNQAPAAILHILGDPDPHKTQMQPLEPMGAPHAGMIAAAGMLNGAVVNGQVIKGSTVKKEIEVVDEYTTDAGSICTEVITAEIHAAQLSLLNLQTGELTMVNSHDNPDAFEQILLANAGYFVDMAQRAFPARFTGAHLAAYRPQLERIRAPRLLPGLPDGLLQPQLRAAAACLFDWRDHKTHTLIGEMGTGKTSIAIAAATVKAAGRKPANQKVIVLLPPKDDLVNKWEAEIRTTSREFRPTVVRAESIQDVQRAFARPGLVYIVLKETMAKLSSGWKPIEGAPRRWKRHGSEGITRRCPTCGLPIMRVKLSDPEKDVDDSRSLKTACAHCQAPLWTATRRKSPNTSGPGYARYPLARYIRDHYRDRYVLILDEAHQLKASDSARGYAGQDLIDSAHKVIQMTGTYYNGMASSMYELLRRSSPAFRDLWGHGETQRFINKYGLFETIKRTYRTPGRTTASGYTDFTERKSERPGVAPSMAALLLPTTSFITLQDLQIALPPYAEHTLFVEKPPAFAAIERYLDNLRSAAVSAMKDGDYSLMAQFTWAKQGAWDMASVGDHVGFRSFDPITSPTGLWPKEEALLRIATQEKLAGRKVLCYVSQINRRDPTPRLLALLQQYGMKGAVMRADEKNRVRFIDRALRQGIDVIFTSAQLVKEGIDLLDLPTIVWYGLEFNTYLIPQANRRSWRIGQTKPVHIYYLAYNRTPQAEGMMRVALKLAAAQALQGDIRQGLAALLSQPDFISRLQAATVSSVHYDSELTLAHLPPLQVFTPKEPPWPNNAGRQHIVALHVEHNRYAQLGLF